MIPDPLEQELSAAEQQAATPDKRAATAELETMWKLADARITVVGARITGHGRDASCEVRLSNGETMVFERLGDIASGSALMAEVASCAGVAINPKPLERARSIALIRALADRQAAETADSIARDWGVEFLGVCHQFECDMSDQTERWACLERLRATDPWGLSREHGGVVARHMLVPVDRSGVRYVRTGWLLGHVRQFDGTVSAGQVVSRMLRVGWQRRGPEGRIGARRPGFGEQTNMKFLLVPATWENLPDELITADNRSVRESLDCSRARDRGITSGYHPENGHEPIADADAELERLATKFGNLDDVR